jgi:hypothetical protein
MTDDITFTLSHEAAKWFTFGFLSGFGLLLFFGTLLLSGGKGRDSQW